MTTTPELPLAVWTKLLEAGFDAAEQLLAQQRAFALRVTEIVSAGVKSAS